LPGKLSDARLFANADVLEAVRGSLAFRVQIAAVNQQRVSDTLGKRIPLHIPKLIPFGENENGIGSLSGLVVAQAVGYVRQLVLGFLHCLRVVGANICTLGQEALHNIQSRSKADIIKFLKDSFALGHKAAATLTAENMLQNPGSSKSTRLRLATFGVAHAYDHYGQMVEYLRMSGIVPPASRASGGS